MMQEENGKQNMLEDALRKEAFLLRDLLGLEKDFFETGTLDDRMAMYSAVRRSPLFDGDSPEARFAKTAPQYELYRYAWGVVRKRFDDDVIRGREEDIEMVFLEAILCSMDSYDPAAGPAGPYFGAKIYAAVYDYLNSSAGSRSARDSRVLRHIASIRERLLAAGFQEISEGDYSLELNNTGIASNRIPRERLRYLLNVPEVEREISQEQVPGFAERLAGDEDRECFRDPSAIVYETSVRQSVIDCIFRKASEEREALAYIAVYYSDGLPVTVSEAAIRYYGGSISRKELAGRLERLSGRLREDIDFMELLGAEEFDIDEG